MTIGAAFVCCQAVVEEKQPFEAAFDWEFVIVGMAVQTQLDICAVDVKKVALFV
jgi:hypothetical protein